MTLSACAPRRWTPIRQRGWRRCCRAPRDAPLRDHPKQCNAGRRRSAKGPRRSRRTGARLVSRI